MEIHRQIWEKKYGNIPSGYIIHHLNFKHGDNRMDNLILLPTRFHSSFHQFAIKYMKDHNKLKEVILKHKLLNRKYINLMMRYNKKWNKEFIVERLIQYAPQTVVQYG